jgi:hypothetical protein
LLREEYSLRGVRLYLVLPEEGECELACSGFIHGF